jgi:hypothetical protein
VSGWVATASSLDEDSFGHRPRSSVQTPSNRPQSRYVRCGVRSLKSIATAMIPGILAAYAPILLSGRSRFDSWRGHYRKSPVFMRD